MGLLRCTLPCHTEQERQAQSNHLYSESSTSSLSSQPSLPSLPSLTSSSQQHAHHQRIATLKGHSSSVSSLALARNHLYSGSSNSEIRILSPEKSILVNSAAKKVVAVGGGAVKSLVVSQDKLFSAHQDHKIRVWKIDNNQTPSSQQKCKCIATLPNLTDRFTTFFSAENYVEIRRHKKCTWVHHADAVSSLAISRDSSLLYSASWDRTFKIWRTSDFKCLESIWRAHDDAINALVVSNDAIVFTGSADKKIKAWKKQEGDRKHSLVTTLEKHKSAVNALAVSTDGSMLYSGACDRSILAWERQGGQIVLVGALRGHTKAILCLAVVSDLVCSGSADRTVRVWRRGTDKNYPCLAVLEGHKQPVKCLTAAVDGDHVRSESDAEASYLVYSGSLDCDIKVWQIRVP